MPPEAAAPDDTIRLATSLADMELVRATADRIWGAGTGNMVSADYLMALSHAGGYIAGAFTTTDSPDQTMVACSFGMLARHRQDWCLHSHITGVIPERQNSGLGQRLKYHQYAWAQQAGLSAITWTFDPLVRRNAWFNLQCLGARAVEFHIDFYGPLNDDINGDDETDRLLARWDIDPANGPSSRSEQVIAPTMLIETPADIVSLRASDPNAARAWRLTMRQQLAHAFTTHEITGLTSAGAYICTPKVKI